LSSQLEVSILDYGVGNLGSICNMFRKLGVPVSRVSSRAEVLSARRLVLPGVGAFDHGMHALESRGLDAALKEAVNFGIPLLGICLGMQLLGGASEEGVKRGLGLIRGSCVRFRSTPESPIKVPHMGWNTLRLQKPCALFGGDVDEWRFYFTHSYHFVCGKEAEVATVTHGGSFTAAVQQGKVFGVQFHPEKSHRFGMHLLRNFGRLEC
jgi:glutamine amidotransferase